MTDETGPIAMNRRGFMQMMGVAAGGAAATSATAGMVAQASPAEAAAVTKFTPRGKLQRQPNFLIVMVDEMRYAPVYETQAMERWRRKSLKNINNLRRRGFEFNNHHVMSVACAPSRASIFTGQYPSLHGVSQTSGAAKSSIEEDMYWLDPASVPTMGHYFRAAGYETLYKGKWHVSDADLYQPGSYQPLPSYNQQGRPVKTLEDIYVETGMLEQYGFTGFIGPEPHGSSPLNSGSSGPNGTGRDQVYAQWGAEQIKRLRSSDKPWLLVTSFVNPHDITLWGNITLATQQFYLQQQLNNSSVPEDLFDSRFEESLNESLKSKPTAQASYRDIYPSAFQPTQNNKGYQRFYYQLQAEVDQHVGKVMGALRNSSGKMQRDTVVIFLSDHGDMLGAHGGLHQKWHCAYDEIIKVPFIFHNKTLFPAADGTDTPTSHADLIPTMLGLAGVNQKKVRRKLRETHTQVRRLPGRDLSPLLLGERSAAQYRQPVYFMTDDQVTRGMENIAVNQTYYRPVVQPGHVETVIAQLATGSRGELEQWKYSRYFDNPDFWSSPGQKDIFTLIDGPVGKPGTKSATTTVKTEPLADQIEVYNVSQDPTEMSNLAADPASADTIAQLRILLEEQIKLKRLTPTRQKRDSGPPGGIGV